MLRIEHPFHLTCPVTGEIFLEPVSLFPSGQTLEKEIVDKIIADAKIKNERARCPVTREYIDNFTTNWAIKSAVTEYINRFPEAVADQYKVNPDNSLKELDEEFFVVSRDPVFDDLEAMVEAAGEDKDSLSKIGDVIDGFIHNNSNIDRLAKSTAKLESRMLNRRSSSSDIPSNDEVSSYAARAGFFSRSDCHKEIENKEYFKLYGKYEVDRSVLLDDIENISRAFKPSHRHLTPIIIGDGPVNPAMILILDRAAKSLEELRPEILDQALSEYAHQYDLVKTLFGDKSLSDGGGFIALGRAIGTVKNQPGYLVFEAVQKTQKMLSELTKRFENLIVVKKSQHGK